MKKELQDKLYAEFPKIFADKDKSKQESCMYWGLAIGDGWYDIFHRLLTTLQWQTDKNSYKQVVAEQVKEKFGSMRFYYRFEETEQSKNCEFDRPNEYLRGLVDFATGMTGEICDVCGKKGDSGSKTGWIRVRCDEHRDNKIYEN